MPGYAVMLYSDSPSPAPMPYPKLDRPSYVVYMPLVRLSPMNSTLRP